MRRLLSLALAGCGVLLLAVTSARAASKTSPPQTVAHVDLSRYTGRWYEIARYPNRFQRKCASDVTAMYSVMGNGKVQVVNACRRSNGSIDTAKAKARVVDRSNARLKVTFFWPFSGDYWILDLGPDYEYAVVGEPKRKYLWILSRTPVMSETLYREIETRLQANGYDTAKLVRTAQGKK